VIVTVINVDFKSRNKINTNSSLSYEELISLVESLVNQGETALALLTLEKQLKISPSSANILLIAIMLDHVADSIQST
jgi:hypothetical protein